MVAMLASIAIITLITGVVASALTVRQLDSGIVHPADLRRVRVASVTSSTSAEYLTNRRVKFRGYATPQDALRSLERGESDAVVYDEALLKYLAIMEFRDRIEVLPFSFNTQEYAIALAPGSELRKPLNEALLRYRVSDAWSDLLYRYLGESQ